MAVSRRNKAYWAERSAAQYAANARRGAASSKRVQGAYEKAIANVDKELEAWYARFAGENGVSILEARKLLTSKELKAFQMDVEEYIARGRAVGSLPEGPAKEAWIKELENVSAKVHVSRLEAMQIRMKQQAELAGGAVDAELSQMAAAVYQDSYYHTAFEVQRGTGVGFEFAQLDNNKIDKIITTPWAADGRNFSDRVWGNTKQLVAELDSTLMVGLIQGKSLRDMSAALSERMGVAQSKAARLVTTENAYFTSAGQRDSYKALGVEEYEIVVTLDSHTSAVCQGLDGKKIAVKDLKPGATAPPFHPNCRCTTVPYFNDEFTVGEKRAARDGADSGYELVPADMTYPEWKERFVVNEREREYGVPYGEAAIAGDLEKIYSPEYRAVFDGITDNPRVNKSLYDCSVKAIETNAGSYKESMYLLDSRDGSVWAAIEKDSERIEHGIRYNQAFKEKIADARDKGVPLLAVHNHPEGYPPSADDMLALKKYGYSRGFAVGANGQVYEYFPAGEGITRELCETIHAEIAYLFSCGGDVDKVYKEVYLSYGLSYNTIKR